MDIHSQIVQQGYQCHLNCTEVDSRGLVTADNAERLGESLKFISGSTRSKKTLAKDLRTIAITPVIIYGTPATSLNGISFISISPH